jgi:hypothetical protein
MTRIFVGLLTVAAVLGCCVTSGALQPSSGPEQPLYFGYIKTNIGAPKRVNVAAVGHYKRAHIFPDGTFIWTDLNAGQRYCDHLVDYGPGWVRVIHEEEPCWTLKEGELRFYGAVEVRETQKAIFMIRPSKVTAGYIEKPTRTEVLKMLSVNPELAGTDWKKKIDAELARAQRR